MRAAAGRGRGAPAWKGIRSCAGIGGGGLQHADMAFDAAEHEVAAAFRRQRVEQAGARVENRTARPFLSLRAPGQAGGCVSVARGAEKDTNAAPTLA